jgi:hypothetical protein
VQLIAFTQQITFQNSQVAYVLLHAKLRALLALMLTLSQLNK